MIISSRGRHQRDVLWLSRSSTTLTTPSTHYKGSLNSPRAKIVVDPVFKMSVDFPASESRVQSPPPPPPNGRFPMPFRRISLPSAPSLLHRHSVVSIASFDSLPEEESGNPPAVVTPRAVRHRSRQRPGSIDLARKKNRRSTSRPVDETRLAKRRKIIEEFYETERSYVNGLDLIHSVRAYSISRLL